MRNSIDSRQCQPISDITFYDSAFYERTAEIFKTIGHPTRLKILFAIMKQVGNVAQICKVLDQPQPIISSHLSLLKNKRIIVGKRKGNETYYRIVCESTRRVLTMIA